MECSVSVIVPVYNVEKYLPRCIDSVLQQSLSLKEIILINDGSTDKSGEICDLYALKHKQIKVIHQNNQGLSAARNAGIEIARGDWLAFLDSDDYIDIDMYETMLRDAIEYEADISVSGVWIEEESGKRYTRYDKQFKVQMNTKDALIVLNSYTFFNMSVWNKLFRSNLFKDIRFPVGKLCEDYYVMHQIIARAGKIIYNSKPFYHYIQRTNSISRNKKINMAPLDACEQQLDFYNTNFPDIAYVAETAVFFSNIGIYTTYIRQGQICPPELLQRIKQKAKKYIISVLKNPHIPRVKKAQALMFLVCRPIYDAMVRRRKHR